MEIRDTAGGPRLYGLCRCHSVWLCPICAPEIRAARGAEISAAVRSWLAAGGGVEFGSATVRHGLGDRLATTYGTVTKAWRGVWDSRGVRSERARVAHEGWVRTVEVTHGANGWHPHIHWLDFFSVPLTSEDRRAYEAAVFDAWSAAVVRSGAVAPLREYGVRVVQVREADGNDRGGYMTSLNAGAELTALSTKEALRTGKTPFDILRLVGEWRGELAVVRLWHEYEQATRGRRMLGWSKGMREGLGVALEDPECLPERGLRLAVVDAEDWSAIGKRPGGVRGVQAVLELAALEGQVGVDRAVRALLGIAEPVVLVGDEQLQLSAAAEVGF